MTFSLSTSVPLFPSLQPRAVDPLWYKVDQPQDEDAELTRMEKEHEAKMRSITDKTHQPPIGRTSQESVDDDEVEEEEEDDNDNDDNGESDSPEEEDDVEMDMNFGQDSPVQTG